MSDVDPDHARRVAEALALETGDYLLSGFRSGTEVHKKGAIDLVTEFDLESERRVRKALASAFPNHRIVGEEGEPQGEGHLVWYVDPLDGTTNFAHGHPNFCVSIALWDESEDLARGLVGVVAAPALGLVWSASLGAGATRNGESCHVTATGNLGDALVATGFPYDKWDNADRNVREFEAFLQHTRGVRRCGSAAIDLAMVADGTYDVYWESRLNAWDMCAGAVLVREAGGQLSDYDGGVADARTGRVVATNGKLHDRALSLIDEARDGEPAP